VTLESGRISRTSAHIPAAGLSPYAPNITTILVWATGKGLFFINDKKYFQRNAAIALGNMGDPVSILLIQLSTISKIKTDQLTIRKKVIEGVIALNRP